MTNVVPIKGARRAPVAERSSMETLLITPEIVDQWRSPSFQRPLRINDKVKALAKAIAEDKVIPGVLTLGTISSDPHHLYVVDGQHRCQAFRESGCREGYTDVRIVLFQDMAEMADHFVELNTALVRMRPDDVLRGLEPSTLALRRIRVDCPWVGYDMIRRGTHSAILSMSVALRCWCAAGVETPSRTSAGLTTRDMLKLMDEPNTQNAIIFLRTAHEAWGRDMENNRLWGSLNLTLCAWIFRKIVLGQGIDATVLKRIDRLNIAQFKQFLMAVSADHNYVDWLVGRGLTERDRSPCYKRLRDIMHARIKAEEKKANPTILRPSWATY